MGIDSPHRTAKPAELGGDSCYPRSATAAALDAVAVPAAEAIPSRRVDESCPLILISEDPGVQRIRVSHAIETRTVLLASEMKRVERGRQFDGSEIRC